MKKVIVISAHPDDETLGCGGTLLKHKAKGDQTHWVICTRLNKNHRYYKSREKEILASSADRQSGLHGYCRRGALGR